MAYILQVAASTFHTILTHGYHLITLKYFLKPRPITPPAKGQDMNDMKNIVILGGSFSGLNTAHVLLKNAKTANYKVTMVSPNTHMYWNLATPRGIIPGQFKDEELFQEIAPGFAHYPAGKFELVIGTAESVDVKAKTVGVATASGSSTLSYDYLVLATGARDSAGQPFKGIGSTEETKENLHRFQEQVAKANKIVIAGAGATGVEVASFLGEEFAGKKPVILIASGPTVFTGQPKSMTVPTAQKLRALKIDLKFQTKVKSLTKLPNGQTDLLLSTGEHLITDLYIPAFGLIPNSSYMPLEFLDSKGFVLVDEYLRVKGLENVWAVGDVSTLETAQLLNAGKQATYVGKSLVTILKGQVAIPYKVSATPFGVSLGKKDGIAIWGGWKLPGMVIAYKRRNLFTEVMGGLLMGRSLSSVSFRVLDEWAK